MANKMLPRSFMSSMLIGFVFDLLVLTSFLTVSSSVESARISALCTVECLSAHNPSGFKTTDSIESES